MKLGISSFTYTWSIGVPNHPPPQPLSAFGLLEQAVHLGVRVLQVADNLPLRPLPPPDLDRFLHAAAARGVALELGTRGLDAANLQFYLDLARRVNAPFVRLVIDSAGDEPTPEEAIKRLRPLVEKCAAAGVKLALENHDRFTARTLAGMVRDLGCNHVGICLDTVNSLGALEGPEAVVATLAPWTLNLHVKDFTIRRVRSNMGFEVCGAPAGQGRLDLRWLLERLPADRDFNAILELWTPPADTLEATIQLEHRWAEQSVAFLRQFIPD